MKTEPALAVAAVLGLLHAVWGLVVAFAHFHLTSDQTLAVEVLFGALSAVAGLVTRSQVTPVGKLQQIAAGNGTLVVPNVEPVAMVVTSVPIPVSTPVVTTDPSGGTTPS